MKTKFIKIEVALDELAVSECTNEYQEIVSISPIVNDTIPINVLNQIHDYIELGYKVVFFL